MFKILEHLLYFKIQSPFYYMYLMICRKGGDGMINGVNLHQTGPDLGLHYMDHIGHVARKPVFGGLQRTKAQTSLPIRAV